MVTSLRRYGDNAFGDNIGKGDSSINILSSDVQCLESRKHTVDIPTGQGDRLKLGSKFHVQMSSVSPPALHVMQLGQYC